MALLILQANPRRRLTYQSALMASLSFKLLEKREKVHRPIKAARLKRTCLKRRQGGNGVKFQKGTTQSQQETFLSFLCRMVRSTITQ